MGAISIVQRRSGAPCTAPASATAAAHALHSTDHMRMASTSKAFQRGGRAGARRPGHALARRHHRPAPAEPARGLGPITLRQLLDHTSGLPDFTKDQAYLSTLQRDPHMVFLPHASLLSFVTTDPLLFAPGTQFNYSNSDNIVVALMAEQATSQPYDALLSSLVFSPLGLNQTSLPDGFRLPAPYIHGYDNEGTPPSRT